MEPSETLQDSALGGILASLRSPINRSDVRAIYGHTTVMLLSLSENPK